MRAVQLLRGSPRRKAVAGFAAAITVATSFFVVQGFAGATVTTAPATHMLAVGPTDPTNGFPVWYKDSNNLNVGLCLDVDNPFCNLGADVPDPTQPVSFPGNFPDETFYQLANSSIALPNGTTAVLDDNLEAAFGTAAPQAGGQIVFGRVRIRITTPSAGHYVVTHPYGVDEFDVTATGTRNINFVEDIGVSPGDFTGALGSRINPFLRWDTGLVTGPDGASYLGDAVTPHAITGSALGRTSSGSTVRTSVARVSTRSRPTCSPCRAGCRPTTASRRPRSPTPAPPPPAASSTPSPTPTRTRSSRSAAPASPAPR